MSRLRLTERQRLALKKPLGQLISGSPKETMPKLVAELEDVRPKRLVTVGDAISRLAFEAGVRVDVAILDRKEKRAPTPNLVPSRRRLFHLSNPAGTIEELAWTVVRQAVEVGDALVEVEGEEDLLTLVAILSVPEGGVVLYGQPDEGVVMVRVDRRKKAQVERFISSMDKA